MKITVCGDVSIPASSDLFRKGRTAELFGDVPSIFSDSDRVLINLECALTDKDTPIAKKGPNIKGTPLAARVFREVGITDCGLSNNHIFDYGYDGIKDTVAALDAAGISYTGFGKNYEDSRKPLIMENDSTRVAIIAVCEHEYCYALEARAGARPFDPFDTIEDIRRAKEENDFVVVTYHGGKEECRYPSPRLMKACRAMVRAGASAVLCQHSHCIGCYEEYEGGHILYGQGNFHFTGFRDNPTWKNGLAVTLTFGEKIKIELIPISVNGLGIELSKGEERNTVIRELEERNQELKSGAWIDGWAKFCESTKERYLGNITRVFTEKAEPGDEELFCGRMHCEAHKDVIDWLCKHPWEQRREP